MNKYAAQAEQAREERRRRRTCLEKKAFETFEDARYPGQTVYQCPYCGKFHRTTQFVKLVKKCRRVGHGVGGYKVKKEVRSLRSEIRS